MSGSPGDGEFGEITIYHWWLSALVQSLQGIDDSLGDTATEIAATLREICCLRQLYALGFWESSGPLRECGPHDVRMDLVIERIEVGRPGTERALVVLKIPPEPCARFRGIRVFVPWALSVFRIQQLVK